MGRGCYKNEKRDLLIVGNRCVNNCFPQHGGCASAKDEMLKDSLMCELRPEFPEPLIHDHMRQIKKAIDRAGEVGKSLFLYTPDMFEEFYFNNVLMKLPKNHGVYLCVNGCVSSFLKRAKWPELYSRGIREIWFGVESGNPELRNLYNKPEFDNEDLIAITEKGRDIGINVCWFLVDGIEDTAETRLETYHLMVRAQPFKFHFSEVSRRY